MPEDGDALFQAVHDGLILWYDQLHEHSTLYMYSVCVYVYMYVKIIVAYMYKRGGGGGGGGARFAQFNLYFVSEH